MLPFMHMDTYIHTWFEDPVTLRNPPATSNSPSFTTVPTTFYTAAGAPVVVDKIYTYGIYMNTTCLLYTSDAADEQ